MSVLAAVRQVATRPRDRWTVLWGALLVVVAAHALWHVAVHPPVDLEVYLLGGSTIRSGADNLYAADVVTAEGLPFTYPPFAALLFLPASLIGLRASGLVIGIVSMACLLRISWLSMVSTGLLRAYRVPAAAAFLGIAVASLAAEPAATTIYLGQVNLLLCWLVAEDVLARRRPWTGVLVGLATGIKLVPGLFIGYYLLTRRWREAAVSAGTAVATVALGFLVAPHSTAAYLRQLGGLQSQVVAGNPGGLGALESQSAPAAVHRLLGSSASPWDTAASAAVVLVAALVVLVAGRFDVVRAALLTALAGLLASPVAWLHHWVWLTPIVVLLLVDVRTAGGRWRPRVATALVAAWIFTVGVRLVGIMNGSVEPGDGRAPYRLVAENSYVILGALTALFFCWGLLAARRSREADRGADPGGLTVPGEASEALVD